MNFDFCMNTLPPNVRPEAIFQSLSDAFSAERHLLPVGPEELQQSFEAGRSMVVLLDSQPVAHTRLVPLCTEGDWHELGSTYVPHRFRGHEYDLCLRMYARFLVNFEHVNILATTTHPGAVKIGKLLGFVTVPRKELPDAVWRASCCCPFSKTKAVDNAHCILAYGEDQRWEGEELCRVRVTRPTAERLGLV